MTLRALTVVDARAGIDVRLSVLARVILRQLRAGVCAERQHQHRRAGGRLPDLIKHAAIST